MDEKTRKLRDAVTEARNAFDAARNASKRSEYEQKFNDVLVALDRFNAHRHAEITRLGLDIM